MKRLALDAFVWTGEGSPTLEDRRKKLPAFLESNRRPIDRAFVQSIFSRDHPGCAEPRVVELVEELLRLAREAQDPAAVLPEAPAGAELAERQP